MAHSPRLIALNAALLAALLAATFWPRAADPRATDLRTTSVFSQTLAPLDAPAAFAQTPPLPTSPTNLPSPAANRPRGQYILLSGRAAGSSTNIVYILDTNNQELIALRWNRGTQSLEGLGHRNTADDNKPGGGGR